MELEFGSTMSNSPILARLSRALPVLIDGGLATELENQGSDIANVLWSASLLRSNPKAIVAAHRAYLDAGAEIVTSASYQASRAGFHQLGVTAQEADELIMSSVALAKRACAEFAGDNQDAGPRFVAASIGPYGAVLNDGSEYRGDYAVGRDVLRRFHGQRLRLLDRSGADVLACETIPSFDEAIVLGELLADAKTPAWVSFSARNDAEISDGTPLERAAAIFAHHPSVVAIGVNCISPDFTCGLIRKLNSLQSTKRIVAYPNAGEHYDAAGMCWNTDSALPDYDARDWIHAGASLIGGCCRIGPADIAAMRDAINDLTHD